MAFTNSKVDIFTTAMRTEFLTSFTAVADPAKWESFTTTYGSTARLENQTFMGPVNAITQFKGYRRFGKIPEFKYVIPNIEFSSEFEVGLRDIQDDQTGGYKTKPAELAQKAKLFPGRAVLIQLAAGTTTACYDGSNFFASSHVIGAAPATAAAPLTGSGNNLAFTAASSDGVNHRMCVLVKTGMLKPLIWQNRKDPDFQDDSGSPESKKIKMVRYWIDMEGAAAYGWWWDALNIAITNTPTVTEIQSILNAATVQLKQFTLPSGQLGDKPEYIHEQLTHTPETTVIINSTGLEMLVRTVLHSSTIIQGGGPVTNILEGWSDQVTTGFLNP